MDKEMLNAIAAMMEEQTQKIDIIIENKVSKKIEALFDGYKLTHEKQWELERKLEKLEARIEALEDRTA